MKRNGASNTVSFNSESEEFWMKKVVVFIGITLFLFRIFENYLHLQSPLGFALNTFGLVCFLSLLGAMIRKGNESEK
ncbi:hypothetical protein [Streptococcus danieliae]|nr:hypothetical protein [Streptococcus danieliae]